MAKNKITDLRDHLFMQLERLQDEDVDVDKETERAKAMALVAGQIIETAKAEIQFLRAIDATPGTDFIPLGTHYPKISNEQ